MKSLNQCPKCKQMTWNINVYLHVTAPGEMYHNFSKTNLRSKDVRIAAAIWETASWWCHNSKCCHYERGPMQVRIESVK